MTREALIEKLIERGHTNAKAFVETCDDDELLQLAKDLGTGHDGDHFDWANDPR